MAEREDDIFYSYLIDVAPTQEEKEILSSILEDERKHLKYDTVIYEELTGMSVPAEEEEPFEKPKTYLQGLKKALFGEAAAIERYRDIRRSLPPSPYKELLSDIISDETRHAIKFDYLLLLNTCMSGISRIAMPQATDTSKFVPDDWVNYIAPLVKRALAETKQGINQEHLYQEFILAGVLVGLGKTPQEAIEQVEDWEKTGKSQLLAKSKMARGYYK